MGIRLEADDSSVVLGTVESLRGISDLWAPGGKRLWAEEYNRTPKALRRRRVRLLGT